MEDTKGFKPRIRVITTGGTIDKAYNFKTGDMENLTIEPIILELLHRWYRTQPGHIEVVSAINKDSLEITNDDLDKILKAIESSPGDCVVIHGTDTMHKTAKYIQENMQTDRRVILTGAMIPFRYNQVEASANVASAMTYLEHSKDIKGVLIAMNGLIGRYQDIVKDPTRGYFIKRKNKR